MDNRTVVELPMRYAGQPRRPLAAYEILGRIDGPTLRLVTTTDWVEALDEARSGEGTGQDELLG